MMIDTVLAALRGMEGISDWQCAERQSIASERYFIGRELDLSRGSLVDRVDVTLFVDAQRGGLGMRGASTCAIAPGMDRSEIQEALDRCAFAAGQALSPWFPLPEGLAATSTARPSSMPGDPETWLDKAQEALFAPADGKARLNSLELFFRRCDRRILNSRGIDVRDRSEKISVEFIVEHPDSANGVELFTCLERSSFDEAELSALMADQLSLVAQRAIAQPLPPAAGLPVLLTREAIPVFFGYFVDKASAHMVYRKLSDWEGGHRLPDPEPGADSISLYANPTLNLPAAAAFDDEGRPLERLPLLEAGTVKALLGKSRYSHYLGIAPTGAHRAFEVAGGSRSMESLRESDHLEVASFSDFQIDNVTGSFGGEVRLGWLVRSGKRTAVTGGSVTGRVADNLPRLMLSRERGLFTEESYSGGGVVSLGWLAPLAIRLDKASIACI